MSTHSHRGISVLLTVALVGGLLVVGAPPAKADVETTKLVGLLDGLQSLVPQLASVGELAEPLPTLAVSPGSSDGVGLDDLLTQARTTVISDVDTASDVDDFVDAINGKNGAITNGRTLSFTAVKSTAGTVDSVAVTMNLARNISSTKLDIRDDEELAPGFPPLSLASSGGVELALTADVAFVLNYDSDSEEAWLTSTPSTPSLSVAASASIPSPSVLEAGLGILGVTLGGGSTYTLSTAIGTSWSDPNNDGKLAFNESGGTGNGELATPGAGAGLVSATTTSGSLSSTLEIIGRSSPAISLPQATATISVSAPDLVTGDPVVSFDPGALDAVKGFLTLSPRDLAQGLAQVASALAALQDATAVGLPFMRGGLDDAIQAALPIAEFLANHVPEPHPTSTVPGLPDFPSLQDLLEDLEAETGLSGDAVMDVVDAAYDATKKKVSLGLNISRAAPASAEDLNPAGTPTTGVASYTNTTLVDSSKDFSPLGVGLIGRQVIAGSSSAIILTAVGDTLTLDPAPLGSPTPDVRWQGGKPANGTSYSIQANDPKIGLVELGNTLRAQGGIANANANVAKATVKPSYDVTIPIVLDLQDPDTTDCDPGPGTAPCPFLDEDTTSGIARIISSLPLPAHRIMLRTGDTPLLTADAPITTDVEVNGTVGFVGVEITGTLKECTTNASADCSGATVPDSHLLTIDLKPLAGADADGDIPVPDFFDKLATAISSDTVGDIIGFAVDGQAHASLEVSVPGAGEFFGTSDPSAEVTVELSDITDLGTLTVTGPDLGQLLSLDVDVDNPLALFGALLTALTAVEQQIGNIPGGTAGLGTEVPLVGRSFNQVIGAGASGGGSGVTYGPAPGGATTLTDTSKSFDDSYIGRKVQIGSQEATITDVNSPITLRLKPAFTPTPDPKTPYTSDSELQGFLNTMQADPSETLQGMLQSLQDKLGTGSSATFAVVDEAPDDVLELFIDWDRSFETRQPIDFSFDLGGTDYGVVGAQATGLLTVEVSGDARLALRLPLSAAAVADPISHLKIDPEDSHINAGVSFDGDGVLFEAHLGPFEASLGNPSPAAPETQLQGGLGVALTNPSIGEQTLSSFVSGLDVAVTGAGVECDDAPDPGSTDLAFCAFLPTYINGVAAGSDADHSNTVIRLPVGSTLSDSFDLTGPAINSEPRLILPDELATRFADAALNLLSFGDGLFGYLQFLEKSLRLASFEGKIPLIGEDIQAGADFIGDLRTSLETSFEEAGVPADTTAGAIRTFFKNEVEPELPALSGTFAIQVTCTDGLMKVGKPNVTAASIGLTTYEYKIVGYSEVDGVDEDTVPSDASDQVMNEATLTATAFNDVTWSESDSRTTGYKVLRSVDGGDFDLLKDVGLTTAYTDDGSDTPESYTPIAPGNEPCPDNTPAAGVDGLTMTVDLGQGGPSSSGCATDGSLPAAQQQCLTGEIPIDLGIPGLSIKSTDDTDNLTAKVGWRLHLKVGLSRDDGFFVQTQDSTTPEFVVGAQLDVPDTTAMLAFIKIDQSGNDSDPEFAGAFSIDLRDEDVPASDCTMPASPCTADETRRLTIDDVMAGSIDDFIKAVLSASVDIDWHLSASVGSAFPGVRADFLLGWTWTSDDPTNIDTLSIAFKSVKLDAGELIGGTIGPIVRQIVDVLKPVQPILDTIFAPLPVLSDFSRAVGGDDVTIASLAAAYSTLSGGPDLQPFLDVVKAVRDLLKVLNGNCDPDPSPCLDVGSFELFAPKAMDTDASPGTAESLIDTGGTGYIVNAGLLSDTNDKAGAGADLTGTGADTEHPGFSFPFLENPASIFGLIVGQDVTLVKFDSGPLTLGFEFQISIGPVFAPPPVNVVIGGGASVTLRIVAGFDTYGIRTAVEKGKVDASILDSLFFFTTDDSGKPIPVVEFEGFIQAGASVSAVIIEVGIVGGIKLTVGFFWNDPNNDGKFRFSEFLAAALSNPICLFNVAGELSLFIKVFITIGFSIFSVSFDFTLVEIKLLDFSLKPDCNPPPPKLGGTKDGTLYLFAGKFGGSGPRGHSAWDAGNSADETWVVRQLPHKDDPAQDAKIVVQALGITEEFDDEGDAIDTVVLDARGYTGNLEVMFNGAEKGKLFDKKVVVVTGSGDDKVRAGSGRSFIDTAGGADEITTFDRPDLSKPVSSPKVTVAGGAGVDSITVGNAGGDTVMGDGSLTFTDQGAITVDLAGSGTRSISGALDPSAVGLPTDPTAELVSDGADQIAAGIGGATLYGNGGDDKIGTSNDNPQAELPSIKGTPSESLYLAKPNTIVGGSGSDRIKSGSADDIIYTGAKTIIGDDDFGSGDADTDVNTVDTGNGNDTVYGSNALDFITTHSLPNETATGYGGDGGDVLIGGEGTDRLSGGPGNDYLVAEPSTVSSNFPIVDQLTGEGAGQARSVGPFPLPGEPKEKILIGGGGHDRIYGGDGRAEIFGDHLVDDCVRQSDPVSKQPPENPTTTGPDSARDKADLILGGDGVDTVQAGGGNDFVFLFGEDDVACGGTGEDEIHGGLADDLVYGGSDSDLIFGNFGADELFGNTDDDAIWGGLGNDRIQGNNGSDRLFGGPQDDTIIGGTSKAAEPDTGDRLYGDTGDDTIVGDNADAEGLSAYPADLDGTIPTAGGKDIIFGGHGEDTAYGGLDEDLILGGTGSDQIEGNNATDTIFGQDGADNIIGGSSQTASPGHPDAGDVIFGGMHDDVIAGDNATITDSTDGSPLTKGRGLSTERTIVLHDQGLTVATGKFGDDIIDGGGHSDVIMGQRGEDVIKGGADDDYLEGGQDFDTIAGEQGNDDIVGGSYDASSGSGSSSVGQFDTGDTLDGNDDGDVIIGDNGALLRDPAVPASDLTKNRGIPERSIQVYDLGDTPTADTSGADLIHGNDGADVILGQGSTDRLFGDAFADYVEGGQASDWLEGGTGADDLVGGNSEILSGTGDAAKGQPDAADVVWGQQGDDVITGDNALVNRVEPYNDLTNRVGSSGQITERRSLRLVDLSSPPDGVLTTPDAIRYGGDFLSGQQGVDVILGQDGPDKISGGSDADYAEGQGGSDEIYGDRSLAAAGITLPVAAWPGSPSSGYDADGGAHGQDDLIGGSSRPGFRDTGDVIHGDGASDFILGDNGTAVREILPDNGGFVDRIYTLRYAPSLPVGAAVVRVSHDNYPSTRFCTEAQTTCEPAGAFGGDLLFGEPGDDFIYGQDGDDVAYGYTGDDDIFGELGDDLLFGEDGDDAILGDRGGLRDIYEDGARTFNISNSQVPKIEYEGFSEGTVTRVTDLLNDINGDVFVGAGFDNPMPHDGISEGGEDRIRGGRGADSIHGGFGDDLINGDSGGDIVFGDDGADVIWGGRGCDPNVDTLATSPDCFTGGSFDASARGDNDRFVDYVFAGKGGTSADSVEEVLGADIIDWRPRGSFEEGTGCTTKKWPEDLQTSKKGKNNVTTIDPCRWFYMTDITGSDPDLYQHHQGIDWQFGGWDRDVLQADVADNGPNQGDRLLDWNGAYNLYTHCNAAYGGFNDVRQHSPTMQDFLQRWAFSSGSGQALGELTTDDTAAFIELAIPYPGRDREHSSGKAYPSTPGHFDTPNACAP